MAKDKVGKQAARIKQLWRQAEQLAKQGKAAEEEQALRAILSVAPDHYGSLLKLSYMALRAGRMPIALEYAKQAVQANHADSQGHLLLGQVLAELGLIELAEGELTIAEQLNPSDPRVLDSLGGVLAQQGRNEEAESAYRRAIALAPNAVSSYCNLAAIKKFKPGDEDIRLIEGLSEQQSAFSENEQIWLGFTLSKVYHDCGEYDRAFAQLQQANALEKARLGYSNEAQQQLTDLFTEVVDADFAKRLEAAGYDAAGPIFVLGMPRSGTTLVESLLSRHPQISGIGEVPYINNLVQSCGARMESRKDYPRFLADLPASLCRQLGEEYMRLTRQFGVNSTWVVDKTPGNFMFVGFILAILPNAKIIHCQRNPMDNCLSIYQQFFTSGMSYANDLRDVGGYYLQYRRLMDHWLQQYQERILNVAYEDVVADSEKSLRRMIDYCGLPWDDRCLQSSGEDVTIRTASIWQARQPVYQSSVERWKKYEKHLGPLREVLAPVL